MSRLRIGSRGSKLALWQAEHIRGRLESACGVESEILVIKTSGDEFPSARMAEIGGKGIFIKEIEGALLGERIDLAVHSMKDVPTKTPEGLCFPAITQREDARDCLVSRHGETLKQLPRGARVGTSSLRRQSQLRYFRNDFRVVEMRGNVDTRLRKLEAGELDAIVLAKTGLDRLELSDKIAEVIEPKIILSAVGQGALAIETRDSSGSLREMLAAFDDSETRMAVTAERSLLAELEGGCQVPLGAWGRIESGALRLDARVLAADGSECIERTVTGPPSSAEQIGRRLARALLAAGADRLLRLAGRSVGES